MVAPPPTPARARGGLGGDIKIAGAGGGLDLARHLGHLGGTEGEGVRLQGVRRAAGELRVTGRNPCPGLGQPRWYLLGERVNQLSQRLAIPSEHVGESGDRVDIERTARHGPPVWAMTSVAACVPPAEAMHTTSPLPRRAIYPRCIPLRNTRLTGETRDAVLDTCRRGHIRLSALTPRG